MANKRRDREKEDKEARPQRKRRKKVCVFCADKNLPNYRNLDQMRRFVSERGKILTKRSSGCCSKHQRAIACEIKKARHLGLLPFTVE